MILKWIDSLLNHSIHPTKIFLPSEIVAKWCPFVLSFFLLGLQFFTWSIQISHLNQEKHNKEDEEYIRTLRYNRKRHDSFQRVPKSGTEFLSTGSKIFNDWLRLQIHMKKNSRKKTRTCLNIKKFRKRHSIPFNEPKIWHGVSFHWVWRLTNEWFRLQSQIKMHS